MLLALLEASACGRQDPTWISKVSRVKQEMESHHIVCLYAIHVWNVTLVNWIAKDVPLEQGTLFAITHVCKPYPGASWDFNHPKVHVTILAQDAQSNLILT